MNVEELSNYLEELKKERRGLNNLLNNLDDKISETDKKIKDLCPHLEREREYDECDQRNYYPCKVCGLL